MSIKKYKLGFTLIEVLIVISILAILIIASLLNFQKYRDKASDARSKSELVKLKIAFEDYYNDNNCYPPSEWFDSQDDCGSANLKPYLQTITCDPKTNLPYTVEYDASSCKWFKIYANLKYTADTAITDLCVSSGGSSSGNFGISSSNVVVGIDCLGVGVTPLPSSTPYPVPPHADGVNACTPGAGGSCNSYAGNPTLTSCPITFSDRATCDDFCPHATTEQRCPAL